MSIEMQSKEIAGGCALAALTCFGVSASSRLAKGLRVTSAGVGALSTMAGVYKLYSDRRVEPQPKIEPLAFVVDAGYDWEEIADVGDVENAFEIAFNGNTLVRGTTGGERFLAIDTEQKEVIVFYPDREGNDIGFEKDRKSPTFTRSNCKSLFKGEFAASTPKKVRK